MMSKEQVLEWVRVGLMLLRDDAYLLQHDLSERCITAKLGSHLHYHLPRLGGDNNSEASSDKRLHVDCEYNRHENDPKWLPWDLSVVDEVSKERYYTPVPDIILHRRGRFGPNVLVIEAKKDDNVNNFAALIDRLKLVGYLSPNLNYAYGLYLSLSHYKGALTIAKAELIEHEVIGQARLGKGADLWVRARDLVKAEPDASHKVCFCRAPSEAQRASAGKLCNEMIEVFSFTDVRKIVEQT
jgi:hypothetical protein